jgi:hypothetical protein
LVIIRESWADVGNGVSATRTIVRKISPKAVEVMSNLGGGYVEDSSALYKSTLLKGRFSRTEIKRRNLFLARLTELASVC